MKNFKKTALTAVLIIFSVVLYFLSRGNYLLFHAIVETYTIVIAAGIFFVSWNSREHAEAGNLVFLGIVYFFIGIIDFFHMLSYTGMNIIPGDIYYANQLWICARFMESISLFIFSVMIYFRRMRIIPGPVFMGYGTITILCLLSVFVWKNFPVCFIKGAGQTPFKIYSEYIICLVLIVTLIIFFRSRRLYDRSLYVQIFWSIVFTILSEFSFTLYTDNFGIINVVGHFFKGISFYLIYRSVIVNMLTRPFGLLYGELKETQAILKAAMDQSSAGILIIDIKEAGVSYINKSAVRIIRGGAVSGEERDPEILLEGIKNVLPDGRCRDITIPGLVANALEGDAGRKEYLIRRSDGSEFLISADSSPIINQNGEATSGMIVFQDITARKVSEERILGELNEKSLILKEVHHRIKNNMNMISSLLKLQSGSIDDEMCNDILSDAAARVESMGVLYERLYRSENESALSIREYIPTLVDDIVSLFDAGERVGVRIDVDDIVLPAKTLSTLGIILCELVTNTMKYAFRDRGKGTIAVSAHLEEGYLKINFEDNGHGYSAGETPGSSSGFGMQLINMLVDQMNGAVLFDGSSGMKVSMTFILSDLTG